ncbi:MAG: hypothetical protein U0U70_08400 [Chitinophagaceae bacterium]
MEEKLNQILRELAYLREQIELARNDSQKFAINLDKEIKNRISTAESNISTQISNISN